MTDAAPPPTATGLRLDSEVCEAIRAEAFAGLKSLPKRGAEVGGLLTQRTGANSTSMVNGFELIPSEHLYGPSYRLSPLDHENFQTRCRELQAGDAVKVAGFFRSSTRETFELTPEDEALIRELLPATAGVVLIKPSFSGHSIFRVFQRAEAGEWRAVEEFEVRATWAPPALVSEPAVTMGQSVEERPVPRKKFASWMKFVTAFGILALFAVSFIVSRGIWKAPAQTARSSAPDLGMQVFSQGDSLRLTWDRSLASVRDSTGGSLQIHDGAQFREVALDRNQVAEAVIYYTPSSDDVTLRLNIQGRESAQLSGMARVLANRKAAEPPAAATSPKVEAQNASNGEVRRRVRSSRLSKGRARRPVVASRVPNRFVAPTPIP